MKFCPESDTTIPTGFERNLRRLGRFNHSARLKIQFTIAFCRKFKMFISGSTSLGNRRCCFLVRDYRIDGSHSMSAIIDCGVI